MATIPPDADLGTHEVRNQPPNRGDRDLWMEDAPLREMAERTNAQGRALAAYGRALGRSAMQQAARNANRNPPELRAFDVGGRRLDEVHFHPAYHEFMKTSAAAGYAAVAWEGGDGAHATHAAMVYLASQVEPGHCCPLTMTYAGIPVISSNDRMSRIWKARLLARDYDPAVRPAAAKSALTLGMAMTEKQGGSDVRSNASWAETDDDHWRLTGHKWFCSAPMSDGFLTLAQTPKGLTCFLVPRWLEDGRNPIRIMRLKDKLGNRSNASAEIEFDRALGHQIGEEGDGIRTILGMVHHTRLDTSLAPAGLMRAALSEAFHWTTHRTAFQRRLIDQPLMRSVLADLTLDWEGTLALGMYVARAFDGASEADRGFSRVAVALAKFMANKLCPIVVCEAMEVLGGIGYTEDTPLPMLFRESPLNGIWEGSGNIICLDVLRTLAKDPAAAQALAAELEAATGHDTRFDSALRDHTARWPAIPPEAEARWFVERTALLLTASTLIRTAPMPVADAFVSTRVTTDRGRFTGSICREDVESILARLTPAN